MIPVTVIVATQNEEKRLPSCLSALKGFQEIVVVDSQSRDKTVEVGRAYGATIVPFVWNRQYPKKRQWCLDTLQLKSDWIFFVDADEIVTAELKEEISALFKEAPDCAGYFVKGHYKAGDKVLKFGLQNKKLVLFDRTKISFPVVDDLDIPGMGEMEGHYQPVPQDPSSRVGVLNNIMIHDALDDDHVWSFKHGKYARWEVGMNAKNAWPADPVAWREKLKTKLRGTKWRPQIVYLSSYVLLGGFLDGAAGKKLAQAKSRYYKKIQELS
jgi:glycosyltransferase involved in cell wall biosynthesis